MLGDGQLGDAVAEQGQFRLDAPAAPGRSLPGHLAVQVANLGVKLGRPTRWGLDFHRW
jgi:hypothetical protein